MGYKDWTRERLTASEMQALVMDQVVAQYAHANARASANEDEIAGQLSWLDDPGQWQGFDGVRHMRVQMVLEVGTHDDLPPGVPIGTEAVTADGQRWEFRLIAGSGYWTWPRGAQGTLAVREYTQTVPLANAAGGTGLSAFDVPPMYIPAGRSIAVEFSGSLSADTTVGSYGFALNFGAPQRRGVIAVPNPGSPGAQQHFTISRRGISAGPGYYAANVVGGRFAGDGFFHLVAGDDGPVSFTITDEGQLPA